MERRDALASLTGRGGGEKRAASEVASDIDWLKVRRVQHGLSRPHERHGDMRCGFLSREEIEIAEARSRRAGRLAHALAFVAGVLMGYASLQGLAADAFLLAASICIALAGLVACRSAS